MRVLLLFAALLALGGCGSAPRQAETNEAAVPYGTRQAVPVTPSRGGYYKNDGPGSIVPDIDRIEDAEPRGDPLHRFANNPYTVFGRSYTPMRAFGYFRQQGLASWYGRMFHGQKTSSGEIYDMYGMTAAHPTLPIPSYAKVTNLRNKRSVVVRVNDRGPFHAGRIIDLSFTAAAKLGYIGSGSTQVEVELIQPQDFPRYARSAPTPPVAAPVASLPAASAPGSLISSAQAAESPSEAGAVYVQLGSFGLRENAESLRSRVAGELAWLKDFVDVLQGDGTFRVQVGPYRNRADAASAAARIREFLQVAPLLVGR
jgi:rare lipoprotein A